MISETQFAQAAASLGCEVAAIKAVNKVEANGNGFLASGKPKILFEGHIFWKQLLALKIDPKSLQAGNEDILYPTWDLSKVRPLYNMDQHQRLEKAKAINKDAALKSASWGAFQIMGFNHKMCDYSTVSLFVNAQADEDSQLLSFCNYLRNTHLNVNLQHLDWAGFARAYNGPEYTKNQYDKKLKAAYDVFKN